MTDPLIFVSVAEFLSHAIVNGRDENNNLSSKRGAVIVTRIPDVIKIGARPTGAPDYSRHILLTDFRHVKPPYYVRGGLDDKTAGVA